MRFICLSILFLACLVPAKSQTIAVNEIMASNATTLADEDGDFGDWIELYNYGSEEVNLEGLGLSDDYDAPFKWVFPDTTLQAGKFILIWATGKNRAEPGMPLHTNFSISSEGEEIILTATDMVRIDEHPPTHIPTDISYGRYPDGTGEFFYFDQPTPLGTNTTQGFTGLLSSPVFSHSSGFYADSFYLKVSHPDPEVILRYTLDGSEPDQESDLFPDSLLIYDRANEPDQISSIPTTSITAPEWYRWMPPMDTVYKGTNIRVKPFREGALNPFAGTKIYWVDDDGTSGYSLPVISLSVDENDLFGADGIFTNYSRTGDYWERPAHITFFEPAGSKGFSTDAGLRVHGGNSRRYALKSFRIYIRNEYGKSQINYPIFPGQEMNVHERLILRNAGSDWARTYFRDAFVQSILKGFSDVEYQAYRPAVLFINGEYWGVTNIRERYDNKYIEHHYGHTEIDMLDGTGRDIKYGTNLHYNNLISYLHENDIEEPGHWDWVQTQMDVEDFRDYHILQIFAMGTDQPGKNVRFWRPQTPEGKWRWMFWDMDDTFLFGPHNNYDRNGLVYCTGLDSISAWSVNLATPPPSWAPNGPSQTFPLRALLMNSGFRTNFINRFADLLNTAFHPGYLEYMIDSFRMQIDDYMYDHYRRWHRPEPEMYETHIQYLHDFAINRQQYMRDHIVEFFHLDGEYSLKLDIASGNGHIRVNSININSEMPSLKEPVYPWEGIYFKGVPLIIEAIPAEGYAFDYWEGTENISSKLIDITGEEDISLKAHFIKEEPSENELIFFWLFDTSLPNDTPLESVDVSYYAFNPATLYFHSALDGYPFNKEHPNWRKASMERRNAPTDINYRPDAGNFTDYDDTNMRGLQVRQPFTGNGGENVMIFNVPTSGYENVLFRFAAKDEGAAELMMIDYSLDEGDGGDWITNGLSDEILTLNDQFLLYEVDFSEVPGADNNPQFKIRIRFDGPDMAADDGNRVTFNNISLEGVQVVTGLPAGPADREREEPDLTIYPNPASSIVFVDSDMLINYILILNYTGQVLYYSTVNSDHHMIDISGLQSGIYLIVVNTGKGPVTRRVQVINQ